MRNSEGDYGVEAIHTRSASWCASMGVVQGETVGIAVLDHPHNPWYPSTWVASEEGLLSPGPSPWRTTPLEPGRSLSLRYRLIVHRGYVEAGWAQARLQEWENEHHPLR
jgi:hypothetical protein